MSYEVKVLADSIADGVRLVTAQVTFPRFILAEVNTHRMLSRSSASSRAIPIEKAIRAVLDSPFMPAAFGANKKGMQAGSTDDVDQHLAASAWMSALRAACSHASQLADIGVHKQWAGRLIETFKHHTAIITATEWKNLFALRRHPAAQPEFQDAANAIYAAMEQSVPCVLGPGQWHLPFILDEDWEPIFDRAYTASPRTKPSEPFSRHVTNTAWRLAAKISAARCARVSYLTHEGKRDIDADLALYEKLAGADPKHSAPLEHAAAVALCSPRHPFYDLVFSKRHYFIPDENGEEIVPGFKVRFGVEGYFCGNFRAPWVQLRKLTPNEAVYG